jgi:hypothetical protein
MSQSALSQQQPFHLDSDPGVRWNANAAKSTPGATANSVGLKQHARGIIERGPEEAPHSYDAATGGKSEVDYGVIYGNS